MRLEKASLKKSFLKILLCVITVLLFGTVLTACNNNTGNTVQFDHTVIFNYNDGYLVGAKNMKENQTLGVDDNSLISIRPGYSNDRFPEGKFSKLYVAGWYLPMTDEDGNLIKQDKDENVFVEKSDRYGAVTRYEYDLESKTEGKALPPVEGSDKKGYVDDSRVIIDMEKEWNFKEDRVSSSITLYAYLKEMPKLVCIDAHTDEEITFWQDEPDEKLQIPEESFDAPKKNGYTFLRKYYTSKDMTQEFSWPYTFTTEDDKVYVEMKKGNWAVVSTAAELVAQMRVGGNIFLIDDIDLSKYTNPQSISTRLWIPGSYNMEFDGNGHVIKNLTRNIIAGKEANVTNGTYISESCAGIFGTLGSKAYIHDVTFEHVTVTYNVNASLTAIGLHVGLFAWKAEEGARIENVTIVNSSLSYHDYNGGVRGSNWIAQDSTRESDIVNCSHDIPVTTIPSNVESGSEE